MAFLAPLAEGLVAESATAGAAAGAAEAGAGAAEGGVVEEAAAGGQTHNLNPAQFMKGGGGGDKGKSGWLMGHSVDLPANTAYDDPGHTS